MGEDVFKKELIRKGAEASLFIGKWFDKDVVFKHRIPKKYRLEVLDKRIRNARTLSEARALIKIKKYGINVPQVYEIDAVNSTIIMKYIPGKKLKDVLDSLEDVKKLIYLKIVGQFIAILHKNGHIHGDITTSNIIITKNEEVFLIDFGLHEYSDTIEDKSVDLHLFKRVLLSSHGKNHEASFREFLNGYKDELGSVEATPIINNISVIETRGRYVKKEDRL